MDQQVNVQRYAHEICSIYLFVYVCVFVFDCVYVEVVFLRRKSMLESRQPEQPQLAAAAAAQTKPAQQTDVRM